MLKKVNQKSKQLQDNLIKNQKIRLRKAKSVLRKKKRLKKEGWLRSVIINHQNLSPNQSVPLL